MKAEQQVWTAALGPFGRIDLSAWISGLSYGLGLFLIGPARLQSVVGESPALLLILLTAYCVFLLTVLRIQKHMRLALSAASFGKPADLYTSGVFHYSRNPIYVAFLLPLGSLACLSPVAAIIATLFYVVAMTFMVIRKEEKELAQLFGPTFLNYVSRTPRWLVW